jgi:hypothetical protein
MRYKIYILFIFISSGALAGCKKPYLPPVSSGDSHLLVVEGVINTGGDSTIIHLSRTIPLSSPDNVQSPPELDATVVIQNDANASYPLTNLGNGNYAAVGLTLNASNKYRLQITAADNKLYQSDFITAKNSPPIDSLNFRAQNNAIQVNVNTHDPSNNTRYYRWDYTETWEIFADYESDFMLQTTPVDAIVARPVADQIYKCWSSDKSNDIVLGSTEKLTNDILVNSPVTVIASSSEKFTQRYSILVKQYALTKDAFEYYQQLRNNTETLGSIFDPQPSSLTGNIHCITNPAESVIGYITAGSVAQKRFYIDKGELPTTTQYITRKPYDQCFLDTLYFVDPKTKLDMVDIGIYHGDAIPLVPLGPPGKPPIAWVASAGICVDCTLRGVNKQPAFWIE